jgi:hypothetical protein
MQARKGKFRAVSSQKLTITLSVVSKKQYDRLMLFPHESLAQL